MLGPAHQLDSALPENIQCTDINIKMFILLPLFSLSILGLRSYSAQSKTSAFFQNETVTHLLAAPPGPSTATVDISGCFPAAARVPVSLQLQCAGETSKLLSPPPGPRALTALISQLVGVAPLHISSLQLVNITRKGLGLRLELAKCLLLYETKINI